MQAFVLSCFLLGTAHAQESAALTVTSTPARASVFLDGRFAGVTPATLNGVGYGRHLLAVSSYRYAAHTEVLEVGQPAVSVNVALKPLARGRIRVETVPDGSEVFLNGSPRGKSPLTLEGLAPGKYELRLEAEGCFTFQEGVEVAPNQEAKVVRTLESKSEAFLLDAIAKDPNRVVNYYDLAHNYILVHQFDKAFQMFARGFDACVSPGLVTSEQRRLYDEFERVWDGQYNFADDKTREGLRPRIFRELEQAIQRRPRNVLNYWSLGQFYEKTKEWEKAGDVYEQGFQAVKSWRARLYLEHFVATARYQQGYALEQDKKPDEALAVYEALVREHPKVYSSRSALQRIAAIWIARQDWAKAIEAKQRYLALYPQSSEAAGVQAEIAQLSLYRLKEPAKALEAYRALIERYPNSDSRPSAQLGIASIYREQLKDLPGAAREYERFLADYPHSEQCATALSALMSCYRQLAAPPTAMPGAKEKVEALRQRLIAQFPGSQEAAYLETDPAARKLRQEAAAAYREAAALVEKEPAKAVEAYQAVVTKYPRLWVARAAQSQLIQLYAYKLKDPLKAIQAREEYVKLFPSSAQCPQMLYQNAYTRSYELKQFDEAIADYRRFLKLYPESTLCPTVQYYLASAYSFTRGHYDRQKNIEEYRKLIQNYPNYERKDVAQVQIAMNFYYQFEPGDKEIAQRELLKAVENWPYGSYATQAEYYLDLVDAGLQLAENKCTTADPEVGPCGVGN